MTWGGGRGVGVELCGRGHIYIAQYTLGGKGGLAFYFITYTRGRGYLLTCKNIFEAKNEENKIARGPFPLKDTKFAFYVFLSRQANEQNNFLIFII